VLKVQNLVAHYGSIEALHGISLEVLEGQIVTILGANGAGKSTTLRTISGIVPATGGQIEFMGKRIEALPPEKIVRLGISQVPEGRELFPELTVSENLRMGAYSLKHRRDIGEHLERVEEHFPILKERSRQVAGTLSGGEQQMLAIGRALMSEPKLLMLDEPSLGLAPLFVREIFNIIKEINKAGITILLVEQNANKALQVADYGYVLETGHMEMQDDASKLLNNEHMRKAYLGG
jgi:branched-chain amino acid transport system ATP-binding protein